MLRVETPEEVAGKRLGGEAGEGGSKSYRAESKGSWSAILVGSGESRGLLSRQLRVSGGSMR